MNNNNESNITNLLIFDGFMTLFLIAELVGAKYIFKAKSKKLFNRKIDKYEETINLDNVEEILNEDYIKTLEFGPIILKYCNVLINTLDKENLQTFYHNINTLKTLPYNIKLTDLLRGKIVGGKYNPDNTIQLVEKYKNALPHELTHMSSTIVKDNGYVLSGFHQVKGSIGYGHGINEGYTQYFTEKHFRDSFPDILQSYPLEMEIVKKLICVIGEKEMENLYFHSNLSGLINSISHYSSLDEAQSFIAAVDFVGIYTYKVHKSKEIKNMLEIKLQQINYILLKCFLNKQKEEQINGISAKKLKLEEEEFDNYLGNELTLGSIFGTNTFNIGVPEEVEDNLRRKIKYSN